MMEIKHHPQLATIAFQRASLADLSSILELEQAAASSTYAATPTEESIRQYLTTSEVFKLVEGQQLVGFASYRLQPSGMAYIDSVVIAQQYRGQRLGTWAISSLLEMMGGIDAELLVHPQNAAAIAAYQKAGFMVSEEVKDHFGDGEPRLRMMRRAKVE